MNFRAYGHPDILATHKTTLEFTKDKEVTREGNCIVGVNSDFSLNELKKITNNSKKIKIIIKVDCLEEQINCEVNKNFNDDKEIVVRKGDFVSERTFGVKADKAAGDLDRKLVERLKNPEQKILVKFNNI